MPHTAATNPDSMTPIATGGVATAEGSTIELDIGGMTCASCANRVERKLNKLDGVQATVNLATEKAKVTVPSTVSTDDLIQTVEKAGYSATLSEPRTSAPGERTTSSALSRTQVLSSRRQHVFGNALLSPHGWLSPLSPWR